jgi:hypothetical protein
VLSEFLTPCLPSSCVLAEVDGEYQIDSDITEASRAAKCLIEHECRISHASLLILLHGNLNV